MKKFVLQGKNLITVTALSIAYSCNLSPGNYQDAEEYEISSNESTLIDAIHNFKTENPQYNVPEQVQLHEGRGESNGHWYHVYFYYPTENQIVNTWTRPSNKGMTTFALIGVYEGFDLDNFRTINKDFDHLENREQKRKFEERILNKIKEKIK